MIGFIILMICLFTKKDSALNKRLGYLSELNITMVLMGTIGGIGAMFSFFISPMLRGYNRISIFIEYACILAVALLADKLVNVLKARINNKKEKKVKYNILLYGMTVVFGCICVFSIWEGCPALVTPAYDTIEAEYTSDKEFVEAIEDELAPGSMIYQLPYHKYPEDGPVNDMADYHCI